MNKHDPTNANDHKSRAERLLAAEAPDPALRAEYERRIHMMLEQKLTRPRKLSLWALTAAGGAMAVLQSALLLTETLPGRAQAALAAGTLIGLAWVVYCLRILFRGTYRRKGDSMTAANMVFGFALLAAVFFAAFGGNADPLASIGFLFLLPAAVIFIRTLIEQSELRTQERLLELEYRLVQRSESPRGVTPPPPKR